MGNIEPEVPEPGAPEPDPEPQPEPEAWSGPSQDEWQQTQQALAYVAQQLTPQPQQPTIDPFSDEFPEQLQSYIQQQVAPLRGFQQQLSLEAAEEQAQGLLQGFASDDPFLFDGSMEKARLLADDYLPQTQQQFGYGARAAVEALRIAHQSVREWENAVGKAYHERELTQLRGLGQVRREPQAAGVNGAAQQQIVSEGPGDEHAILAKYFR